MPGCLFERTGGLTFDFFRPMELAHALQKERIHLFRLFRALYGKRREMCGKVSRSRARGYHSAVEVRFVAFVRVREERELRDAEDISVDIFHALLPH